MVTLGCPLPGEDGEGMEMWDLETRDHQSPATTLFHDEQQDMIIAMPQIYDSNSKHIQTPLTV